MARGRWLDIHAGAYAPYLHRQAFGTELADDLEAVRGSISDPPAEPLLRALWSMAACAAIACGRSAPSLDDVARSLKPTGTVAAELLSEAAHGLYAGPGGDAGGGGEADYSASLLSLALARGIAPRMLADTTMRTLDAALRERGRAGRPAARKATAADIMRLLG